MGDTDKMNAAESYARLRHLVEESVAIPTSANIYSDLQVWAGKIYAVLMESGMGMQAAQVSAATSLLTMAGEGETYIKIRGFLMQCLAIAELKAPASDQGAFIATGNAFDAFAAVGKVLGTARKSVRIVDPYMDEKALTDFAILAPATIDIELLADSFTPKASLPPAVRRWKLQYAQSRSLDARMSAPRALHDRLIIIDSMVVHTVTQSLADMAGRSPASITRDDTGMAALKVEAYEAIWLAATPIP